MGDVRARADRGFTLVELMTVVAILAILVTVAIATFTLARERSAAVACRADQRVIIDAVTQYEAEHTGEKPADLAVLRPRFLEQRKGFGTCPLDDAPYVYDPDTGSVTCPNHSLSPT